MRLTENIAWIGGYKSDDEWVWTDSSTWNYDNWYDQNSLYSEAKGGILKIFMTLKFFESFFKNLNYVVCHIYFSLPQYLVFNYGSLGKFHSGSTVTKLPYICQKNRTEFNFEFKKVLLKIENLIFKLSLLFNETVDNQPRVKRNTLSESDLCSEIEKFSNKFGQLKDGPIFSIPILGVSSIVDDVFLNKLKSLDESSNFHISKCGLQDSKIYVIRQELEELKDYLGVKKFDDKTEKWVEDETCLIGSSESTTSGTQLYLITPRCTNNLQYLKVVNVSVQRKKNFLCIVCFLH